MDIEKAKRALVNAHEAGDTAAAREIAGFIKSYEAGPRYNQREAFGVALSRGQIPFGGKATSALAAGVTSPFLRQEGESLPQAYSRLYDEAQDYQAALDEQYPGTTTLGQLTGVATTLPAAFAKTPAAVQGVRGAVTKGVTSARDIAGKVAGYSPFKGSGAAPKAANLATKMAGSAAVAAPVSGLYAAGEAEPGQMREQFEEGGRMGAIVGAAFPPLAATAGGLKRAVTPVIDEPLQEVAVLAQKYKIPLSIDQVSQGRFIKNAQKVSQELPFSGQEAFRDKQMKAMNKALLRTVGLEADSFTRGNMDKAFLNLGHKFDRFGKGKTFDAQPLKQGIEEILAEAPDYATQDAVDILRNNINKVLAEVRNGKIDGSKLNTFRARVNKAARKTTLQDAGELLKDLENVIIETVSQGGDETIRQAKQQYKNLLVLEPLAAKAKGGNISMPQLTTRVNRVYGRQFVRGKAGEIGELADVGRELLPELGGSDTMQKILTAGAVVGGAVDPSTLLLSGGAVGINRALQSGVNRNQAIIQNMTKRAQKELMELPPRDAQQVLDSIAVSLGIGTGVTR